LSIELEEAIMQIIDDNSIPNEAQKKILFKSSAMLLDLRYIAESTMEDVPIPEIDMKILDLQDLGHLGPSATADLNLLEGQVVTFILRCPPKEPPIPQAIPRTETAKEFRTSFEGSWLKHLRRCCSPFSKQSSREPTNCDQKMTLS
jgi:hypothetical protein